MAFHLGPAGEENLRALSEAVIGHWTRVGLLVSKKETGGEVKSSKRTPGFALFSLRSRKRSEMVRWDVEVGEQARLGFRLTAAHAVDRTSASPVVTCLVISHMLLWR